MRAQYLASDMSLPLYDYGVGGATSSNSLVQGFTGPSSSIVVPAVSIKPTPAAGLHPLWQRTIHQRFCPSRRPDSRPGACGHVLILLPTQATDEVALFLSGLSPQSGTLQSPSSDLLAPLFMIWAGANEVFSNTNVSAASCFLELQSAGSTLLATYTGGRVLTINRLPRFVEVAVWIIFR